MNTKPRFTIPAEPVKISPAFTQEEIDAARARLDEKERTPEWVKDLLEMRAQQQAEGEAQENDKV